MFKSIIVLILAMLSIQFGASQAKQLFSVVGVAGTSTLRLFFASLMMAIAFRPWKIKFTREMKKGLLAYGASLGIMNFSFYFALQRIPLGIAVALEFLGPLSVAIFASKKKIDYLWVVLAGIGIVLLLPKGSSESQLDLLGIILALIAGAFWAVYIVFGKKAGKDLKGGIASSMGMSIAAMLVLPVGLVIDGDKIFNLSALPLALMVALFGSALPYTFEMYSLKRLPQQTFGIMMSLEPAVAALMGLIFLQESLTLLQTLAIGCVVVSSLGSTYSSSQAS